MLRAGGEIVSEPAETVPSNSIVLLANDVSSNPGPATSLPFEAKGLREFHINICSLRNKMDELRLFCDKFKPHVLSLNETWLDDSFSDVELSLPGYQLMRRDRDRHGGGIAVYIADNLSLNRLDTPADNIEALCLSYHNRTVKRSCLGLFTDHQSSTLRHLQTAWRKC